MNLDRQKFSCELLNCILNELDEALILTQDEKEFKYLEKVHHNLSLSFVTWNNFIIRSEKK